MPPFALAYGVKCAVCHTQAPALNAYGRYVQRTGYASLDPHVLRSAFPVWIGEQANYDSTQTPTRPQGGNLAIHAVGGVANDWTYHVQQWIWQNNQSGDLDTLWVAYNNLLHRDGHLFVGKIESPGPSPYSQWFDLSAFTTPEITVGEHVYQLDGNRWGAKLNYVRKNLDLEAGWLYSNGGWSGSSDFSENGDKTFVWKAAYADATKPFEGGLLGSSGVVPVSNGIDRYDSIGAYVQLDPVRLIPGFLVLYQSAYDSNPGTGFASAHSNATTAEIYQTAFHSTLALAARTEWTNDGLGNSLQTGNIDLSYAATRYLRVYLESGLAQNSKPAWRYTIWWTFPLIGGTR